MAKIVNGNVQLTLEQLRFERDFRFSLFKVKGKQLFQTDDYVPCLGAHCSNDEFENWACHDQEDTLFGHPFPNRLPILLFLNAKEGETITFTYNNVECHLILNQRRSGKWDVNFENAVRDHINLALERANIDSEWEIESASRCYVSGSMIYSDLTFKSELEELNRMFE
jgi:hypothetical protein